MVPTKTNKHATASENQDTILIQKEALLKRLVRKVENLAPLEVLQRTAQTVDEVLLDLDLDGIHYYLIRCRPTVESKVGQISLSPRERTIAQLVAQGLPNKSIGERLEISPWTVATHIRRIFTKLDVTSRTAMVTRLIQENLLQD